MKKEATKHIILWSVYFVIILLINRLFSLTYWQLYVGGLFGLALSYADSLLYVFVLKAHELTSQRVISLFKNKQYKEALVLLYDTNDERKDLMFHTVQFQIIFTVLTFWVITSSGNLFAVGLVLGYFLCLVMFNFNKFKRGELVLADRDSTKIYVIGSFLALFIFSLLI